jgi:hypothetical protein
MENLFIALAMLSTLLQPSTAFGQGSLTPPGAPAPTMMTLSQIEPRTPIASVPFTITASGSYYLTTNLYAATGTGITISNNSVTVDLNGFALTGGASSAYGVYVPASQTNVTVRNGSIIGWQEGVVVFQNNSRAIVFERLAVSNCGQYGIYSLSPAWLRDCLCVSNQYIGIFVSGGGQVTDCDASYNGNNGITVTSCIVRNCSAANNGHYGIYVTPGTVSGCWVQNNVNSGIYLISSGCAIIGSTCAGNNSSFSASDAGIYVNGYNNRIEDNHVSGSGYAGISVTNTVNGNIIVKNSVSGNAANDYLTPGNQVVGPLITTYGTITNSNPWANFSY